LTPPAGGTVRALFCVLHHPVTWTRRAQHLRLVLLGAAANFNRVLVFTCIARYGFSGRGFKLTRFTAAVYLPMHTQDTPLYSCRRNRCCQP